MLSFHAILTQAYRILAPEKEVNDGCFQPLTSILLTTFAAIWGAIMFFFFFPKVIHLLLIKKIIQFLKSDILIYQV